MTEFNTPTKIVNPVKMTLRITKNEVQIGRKLMILLKLLVDSGKMVHFLPSYVLQLGENHTQCNSESQM
jgi:hypothetical protein